MIFNTHSDFSNRHAFLSASKSSWLNYTDEKLARVYTATLMAHRGTEMHAYANDAIRLRIRQDDNGKTLNTYINDAIGYRMTTEQTLYYSDNAFGTVDAISFRNKMLRIHDLKTGITPVTFTQLITYAAFFCLEYRQKPNLIQIELRIYQSDDIQIYTPEAHEVFQTMEKIKTSDKIIEELKGEVIGW